MRAVSAARNGRSDSLGLAAAVMAAVSPPPRSRRVGKGAGQGRRRFQAQRHSAVPTRSHIQADAKDRVGTAHDRPCPDGNAMRAPLPTLRLRDRVMGFASRSSLHSPLSRAVLLVFELHPQRLKLIANAIGLLEVLRLAR